MTRQQRRVLERDRDLDTSRATLKWLRVVNQFLDVRLQWLG